MLKRVFIATILVLLAINCALAQPLRWRRLAHACCRNGQCFMLRMHTTVVVEEP